MLENLLKSVIEQRWVVLLVVLGLAALGIYNYPYPCPAARAMAAKHVISRSGKLQLSILRPDRIRSVVKTANGALSSLRMCAAAIWALS